MVDELSLLPRQARQARALLAWSQRDLATNASLAVSTVADFERGVRTPVPNNLEAMRAAFERAGVAFGESGEIIRSDPESEVAARLGGLPIRFVDATDLAGEWADRRIGAQEQMPAVITKLIRASVGLSAHMIFPAADSVQQPGFDGFCEIDKGTEFIPTGRSVWEFGAQRNGITGKANDDFRKRVNEIPPSDRQNMTFVFVTPRRWREKTKWLKERRAERAWRSVEVFDADRLVHWLELYPAVGHWLATLMGKRPRGVRQIQEIWSEWSLSTNPPMTADLMLAGRDAAAADTWRWLNGAASVLAIKAESAEEALAFGYAAIQVRPPDSQAALLSRSLLATDPDQARMLGDSLMPLFLFLEEPDPGLAISLARRGHHVYAAYGAGTNETGSAVSLARPRRYELQSELEAMQIDPERAAQLAQDAAQSLTVLRRLMPAAPGLPIPDWAQPDFGPSLIVALLAGTWNESYEGDCSVIERLANSRYQEVTARLTPGLGPLDSPLRKAGVVWKIASPRDAWFRLAPRYLTEDHLRLFAAIAVEVLGTTDPRFHLAGDERWLASAKGVRPTYSDTLKEGMTETLGLFAIFGGQMRSTANAEFIAEKVVHDLLANADERQWWSLSSRLAALAEACPQAFLAALEGSLDQDKPTVMVLFQEDEGGLAGRPYHLNLLFGLEILARSPRYLGRVARVLARLAVADPKPNSRHRNRPARSLHQIFSLFFPQTNAPLSERLRILNVLRKEESEASWRLLLGLLPKAHAVGDQGPLPRWRDFSSAEPEEITWPLIAKGAEVITGWLFEEVGLVADRWEQLLEVFSQFSPERRSEMVALLREAVLRINVEDDRTRIWKALRHLINHHRKFAKSDWALPETELAEMEVAYKMCEPRDPVTRVAWMFSRFEAELLQPSVYNRDSASTGMEIDRRESDVLRRIAVEDLLGRVGIVALNGLARTAEVEPGLVGLAVADAHIGDSEVDKILVQTLQSDDNRLRGVGSGLVFTFDQRKGASWSSALLRRAAAEEWAPDTIAHLLTILPGNKHLWERVSEFGTAVENLYWRRILAHLLPNTPGADFEFLATKLIEHERAQDAVRILVLGKNIVRASLLADALEAAADQPLSEGSVEHNATMFQYYVEELLQRLDESGEVSDERVALIEWRYLPVLLHSRRTTLTLHKAMAQLPELFVMVIRTLYKPDPESGLVEKPLAAERNAELLASRAYDLLRSWSLVPGSDGSSVDAAILEEWVEKTRMLCDEIGRRRVGDHCIGQMLAHAPAAENGIWPAKAVREVIKITRNQDLDNGVVQGLFNKRGATWRDPSAGGAPERSFSGQYKSWAREMELEWPRTSAILEQVARMYENHGRAMDDDSERRNW